MFIIIQNNNYFSSPSRPWWMAMTRSLCCKTFSFGPSPDSLIGSSHFFMMPLLMAMIIITLLCDAVGDDGDDADPYWRHLRYNASFMDSRFYTHPWPKDLGIIKIITKLTNNLHWLSWLVFTVNENIELTLQLQTWLVLTVNKNINICNCRPTLEINFTWCSSAPSSLKPVAAIDQSHHYHLIVTIVIIRSPIDQEWWSGTG